MRVAEKVDGEWVVHQWLKKAVLLSFRLSPNAIMRAGELGGAVGPWWDKVDNKFDGTEMTAVRRGWLPLRAWRHRPPWRLRGARNAVLMPSFVKYR